MHRTVKFAGLDAGLRAKFLNHQADFHGGHGRGQHGAELDRRVVRQLLRPLPEHFVLRVAKQAAPKLAQADRHHRHRLFRLAQHSLETAAKRQHDARTARERAFREQTDRLAPVQRLGDLPQRLHDLPGTALAVDQNRIGDPEEPFEEGVLGEPLVGDKANMPRRRRPDEQPVHVGDVVAQQQHRSGPGDVLPAKDVHAIEGSRDQPEDRSHGQVRDKKDPEQPENEQTQRDREVQPFQRGRITDVSPAHGRVSGIKRDRVIPNLAAAGKRRFLTPAETAISPVSQPDHARPGTPVRRQPFD